MIRPAVHLRKLWIALGVGAVAGVLGGLSFGPLVRYAVAQRAKALGLTVSVGTVSPTLHGAELWNTDVRLDGVPSVAAHFDSIEILLGFKRRSIFVRGGILRAEGDRGTVLQELQNFGNRQRASAKSSREGVATEIDVRGLDVTFAEQPDGAGEALLLSNLELNRKADLIRVAARSASYTYGTSSVAVELPNLSVRRNNGKYQLETLGAGSATVDVSLKQLADKTSAAADPSDAKHEGRSAILARLASLSSELASKIHDAVDPEAQVGIERIQGVLRVGANSLQIGPGALRFATSGNLISAEFTSGSAPSALRLKATIPVRGGERLGMEVHGGPIPLSALGIREGDLGLLGVSDASIFAEGTVAVSEESESLLMEGELKANGISLHHPALSEHPVRGLDLRIGGKAEARVDGTRVQISSANVAIKNVEVNGRLSYSKDKEGAELNGDVEAPLVRCQTALEAIPEGLAPVLRGIEMEGSIGLSSHLDTRLGEEGALVRSLEFRLFRNCQFRVVPENVSVERFRRPFTRLVYGPGGERVSTESGPGTESWTEYRSVSKFLETAILVSEDGRFLRHDGFDDEAIRNSIRGNLSKGRFERGASTLTMQLAKNLYLEREKTLARKVQEFFLTMYLEQALSKEQILELYFNVVEFGPMIYGVRSASRHYFKVEPSELSIAQAFFLASILPNPKAEHFSENGDLNPGWANYVRRLMEIAYERHRITRDELEEGLREKIVFGVPAVSRGERGEIDRSNEEISSD